MVLKVASQIKEIDLAGIAEIVHLDFRVCLAEDGLSFQVRTLLPVGTVGSREFEERKEFFSFSCSIPDGIKSLKNLLEFSSGIVTFFLEKENKEFDCAGTARLLLWGSKEFRIETPVYLGNQFVMCGKHPDLLKKVCAIVDSVVDSVCNAL